MAVKPTKLETISKQLHRPAGVNIAQLQKVTGWQPEGPSFISRTVAQRRLDRRYS